MSVKTIRLTIILENLIHMLTLPMTNLYPLTMSDLSNFVYAVMDK